MEAALIALTLVVLAALAIKVFKKRSELREQQAVYDRAKQNEHIADVNAMREHALEDARRTKRT